MSRLSIPIILFVLLLTINGAAQKKVETVTCPNIFLSGPAGIVNPGEVGNYTLTFKRLNLWARYTFTWSVKGGELVEGQGTEHARVKRADSSSVTVSVSVSGQPKGCPSTFTDTTFTEWAPEPIKIFELQPDAELAEREIALLVSEHTKNPNNQIYILVGHLYGKASPEILKKEQAVRASLVKVGIPTSFITFRAVYAEAGLMQFWRVPPGANNPKCKECERLAACPTISVIEPKGVTNVGDTAEFKLDPAISKVEALEFFWSLSAGTIENGQGTNAITVRTDSKVDAKTLTATVSIKGLPKECENTAKGEAVLYKFQGDILSDEFGRIPLNDQRGRLDSFVMDLIRNPNQIGYVVLNYEKGTKDSEVLKRVRFIKDHIFGFRKLAKDRLVILSEPSERETTKIYRLPREDANGFCSTCKTH